MGWKVISTGIKIENDEKLKKSSNVELYDLEIAPKDNIILVLGSEGNGVSQNIFKMSDYFLFIPPLLNKSMIGKFPFNVIDSLNVGVTAGIIINHIMIQLKDELNNQNNVLNKKI